MKDKQALNSNRLVCVMRLNRWDTIKLDPPLARLQGPTGSIGFLEVYESKEAALRAWPKLKNSEIITVQAVKGA